MRLLKKFFVVIFIGLLCLPVIADSRYSTISDSPYMTYQNKNISDDNIFKNKSLDDFQQMLNIQNSIKQSKLLDHQLNEYSKQNYKDIRIRTVNPVSPTMTFDEYYRATSK